MAAAADAVTDADADAIVLAQASMAPAAGLVATTVPVFSSPRAGLAAGAAAARGVQGPSSGSDRDPKAPGRVGWAHLAVAVHAGE